MLVATACAPIRWLAARPEVDAARTGTLCHSRGRDIALATGRTKGAGAVFTMAACGRRLSDVGAGIRNVMRRLAAPNSAQGTLARYLGKDVSRLWAPVLVRRGTRDTTVPPYRRPPSSPERAGLRGCPWR